MVASHYMAPNLHLKALTMQAALEAFGRLDSEFEGRDRRMEIASFVNGVRVTFAIQAGAPVTAHADFKKLLEAASGKAYFVCQGALITTSSENHHVKYVSSDGLNATIEMHL